MAKQKVAIFGITANPPHAGHMQAAIGALESVDEVWIVPSVAHALKSDVLDYEHRVRLCELVRQDFLTTQQQSQIKVVELELVLAKNENDKVYTIDLMRWASEKFSSVDFVMLFGQDNKENIKKYKDYEELKRGWEVMFANEIIPIHSSDIRRQLEDPKANTTALAQCIGVGSWKYITTRGLFSDSKPPRADIKSI